MTMNTMEIKKLHELLRELLEFLRKHRGKQNINFFYGYVFGYVGIPGIYVSN